ncbi:proline/betaine transporter domain protein [Rickettsia rhipicephali str. Ect]|uniref:Proline/betaine transporter domain protein n=1 Tax=Rickettsia rhipicephali str. Ect TaxID=1359199 RepID=A0A0F3PIP5_RICRH|nr:proline/betaine transporter domain protein [Rickettsia rhipicephali str. Ect]
MYASSASSYFSSFLNISALLLRHKDDLDLLRLPYYKLLKLNRIFPTESMAITTAGIGLLPSYKTIGIVAPIILTIIRLIQGFSLGGEFSGCISYIVEHASFEQ